MYTESNLRKLRLMRLIRSYSVRHDGGLVSQRAKLSQRLTTLNKLLRYCEYEPFVVYARNNPDNVRGFYLVVQVYNGGFDDDTEYDIVLKLHYGDTPLSYVYPGLSYTGILQGELADLANVNVVRTESNRINTLFRIHLFDATLSEMEAADIPLSIVRYRSGQF